MLLSSETLASNWTEHHTVTLSEKCRTKRQPAYTKDFKQSVGVQCAKHIPFLCPVSWRGLDSIKLAYNTRRPDGWLRSNSNQITFICFSSLYYQHTKLPTNAFNQLGQYLALLVTDVTSVNFCDQQMRHTVTHNSRLPNLLPAFHVTQEQIFWRRCLVLILTNNKLNIKHRAWDEVQHVTHAGWCQAQCQEW